MMLSPAVVGNFWTFLYQPQIGLFNYAVDFLTGADPSSFSMIGVGRAGALGDRHRRHLDVDAVRHADLPRRPAVDPRLHLRGGRDATAPQVAAVLDDHHPDGAALPDAGGAVPRHRELQDVRPRGATDRRRPGLDHRAHLDRPQARGLREVAHRLRLGLCGHPVRHRLRPRLDLREGPQQGEGTDERLFRHRALAPVEVGRGHRWSSSTRSSPLLPLVWIIATGFKTPSGRRSPIRRRSSSSRRWKAT